MDGTAVGGGGADVSVGVLVGTAAAGEYLMLFAMHGMQPVGSSRGLLI